MKESANYRCNKCLLIKGKDDFHLATTPSRGRVHVCKECRRKLRSVMETLLGNARKRAKKRGLACNITRDAIIELNIKQKGKCVYSGATLDWDVSNTNKQRVCPPNRASLDRIDPNKGYVIENVQLVTDFMNRIKTWYPHKDFIDMCRLVVKNFDQ